MGVYHFVGSYCEIDGGRVKLERFGQRIELTDDIAKTVIMGGGAILPEAEFKRLGFTDAELKDYQFPGPQENAPEGFRAKKKAALVAYAELAKRLGAGGSLDVPAETKGGK